MKVQPSIKRRSPKESKSSKGYFARRKGGVLYYFDKTKPRHKQRQG